MKQKIVFALLVNFLIFNSLFCQKWSIKDSILLSLKNQPEFSGSLDGKQSYVVAQPVNIFGIRAGVDYKKTAFYGGIYGTAFTDALAENSYQYFYISATGEYRWYHTHRWQVNQTVQLGIGSADIKRTVDGEEQYYSRMIVPVETGAYVSYRVWKFIGLAAGVGIRISATPGTYFSGSYYSAGLTFYADELMKILPRLSEQ